MADTDRFHEQEDDGYVVADMSGIEQTPLLIPRPGAARERVVVPDGRGRAGRGGRAGVPPPQGTPPP